MSGEFRPPLCPPDDGPLFRPYGGGRFNGRREAYEGPPRPPPSMMHDPYARPPPHTHFAKPYSNNGGPPLIERPPQGAFQRPPMKFEDKPPMPRSDGPAQGQGGGSDVSAVRAAVVHQPQQQQHAAAAAAAPVRVGAPVVSKPPLLTTDGAKRSTDTGSEGGGRAAGKAAEGAVAMPDRSNWTEFFSSYDEEGETKPPTDSSGLSARPPQPPQPSQPPASNSSMDPAAVAHLMQALQAAGVRPLLPGPPQHQPWQ